MNQRERNHYKYTFYVFSNRDSDNVKEFVQFLFETLEGIRDINRRIVTGFNPERDMIPGRNVIREHYRLLKESRYTFVVVDPSFMTKAWDMYLSESTLKSLTEGTAGSEGHARCILITLEITKEAVVRKFPQLNIKENVHFQGDYKSDESKWARLKMAVKNELEFENVEQDPDPIDHDRTGSVVHPSESSASLTSRDERGFPTEPEESLPPSLNSEDQGFDVRPRETFQTSVNRKRQDAAEVRGSSLSSEDDEEEEKGASQPDTYMEARNRSTSTTSGQISVTPVGSSDNLDVVDGSPKHSGRRQSRENQPMPKPPARDVKCEKRNVKGDVAMQAKNHPGAEDNTSYDTVDGASSFDIVDGATANPPEICPTKQPRSTTKGLTPDTDSGFDEERTISGVNLQQAPRQAGVEMSLDNTRVHIRLDALDSLSPEQQRRNIEQDEAFIRAKQQQKEKKEKSSHGVTSSTAVSSAANIPGNVHVGPQSRAHPVSTPGVPAQNTAGPSAANVPGNIHVTPPSRAHATSATGAAAQNKVSGHTVESKMVCQSPQPRNRNVGSSPESGLANHPGQNLQNQQKQYPVTTSGERGQGDGAAESKQGGNVRQSLADGSIRSRQQKDRGQQVLGNEAKSMALSGTDKEKWQESSSSQGRNGGLIAKDRDYVRQVEQRSAGQHTGSSHTGHLVKSEAPGNHGNRLSNETQRDRDQTKALSTGDRQVTGALSTSSQLRCSPARVSPQLDGSRTPSEHDEDQPVKEQRSRGTTPQQIPCTPGTMLTPSSLIDKPVGLVTPFKGECTYNSKSYSSMPDNQQRRPSEHGMPSLRQVDTGGTSEMNRQLNAEENRDSQFPTTVNRSQSGTSVTGSNEMNRTDIPLDSSVDSLSLNLNTLNQNESERGTVLAVNPVNPVPGNMSPSDVLQANSLSEDTLVKGEHSQDGDSAAVAADVDTSAVSSSVPCSDTTPDDQKGSLHPSTESASDNTDTGSTGFFAKAWNWYKQVNG